MMALVRRVRKLRRRTAGVVAVVTAMTLRLLDRMEWVDSRRNAEASPMKPRMTMRLFHCERGTAAVEAAIFAPIFLTLTLGVTDLGTAMFVRMTLNAATQSGAAYAVIHQNSSGCASLTPVCLNGIEVAMNNAASMDGSNGQPALCTGSVCSASLTSCPDPNGGTCFTISVSYPFSTILPSALYSWSSTGTVLAQTIVRVS
jgi:Flp pilus assembly protein TadG